MIEDIYAQTAEQAALLESYMAQIQLIMDRFNRWMTVIEIVEFIALGLSITALIYVIVITAPKKRRKKGGAHG